jgi:hypothetical protein
MPVLLAGDLDVQPLLDDVDDLVDDEAPSSDRRRRTPGSACEPDV